MCYGFFSKEEGRVTVNVSAQIKVLSVCENRIECRYSMLDLEEITCCTKDSDLKFSLQYKHQQTNNTMNGRRDGIFERTGIDKTH